MLKMDYNIENVSGQSIVSMQVDSASEILSGHETINETGKKLIILAVPISLSISTDPASFRNLENIQDVHKIFQWFSQDSKN